MLGRRLVRFATEDASPAGLVVEVEEVGTDAWPSVVLSVAAPNTAGYLGVELFFLFFGLAVGVVRWRTPLMFLAFVCVLGFNGNPWITCELFVSVTCHFFQLFFLMKNM